VAVRRHQLIVEGELTDEQELVFEGFTLSRAVGTTTLTSFVHDQAELHRLLRHVTNLGLTLLEITAIDEAGRPLRLHEQVLQEQRARRRGIRWHRAGQRPQVGQAEFAATGTRDTAGRSS
jgi:hypothetical protein